MVYRVVGEIPALSPSAKVGSCDDAIPC
jgi:hypothetical protein